MSDLREKIARVLAREYDAAGERHWEFHMDEADAVLAVLPSEGWERVGWVSATGSFFFPMEYQGNTEGSFAVYRRVDGAAPPEPAATVHLCGSECYEPGGHHDPIERCTKCGAYLDGPGEVERLREALTAIRNHANDGTDDAHLRLVWIVEDADAALSGQQDTERTER